ncbi:hypothetical protein [Paenibacillus sp. FSL H8-0034]|uniref:hypothetical protein n=1 Tax=Paenibacillus sp. FSL H8-0034 TaxID=2954671 RepID=UPI0030FBCF73
MEKHQQGEQIDHDAIRSALKTMRNWQEESSITNVAGGQMRPQPIFGLIWAK